jgi:Tfp pilus assembly protein PilO
MVVITLLILLFVIVAFDAALQDYLAAQYHLRKSRQEVRSALRQQLFHAVSQNPVRRNGRFDPTRFR